MFGTKPELKRDVIADAAAERRELHTICVVRLLFVQLAEWGNIIEAIEGEGWQYVTVTPIDSTGNVAVTFRAVGGE